MNVSEAHTASVLRSKNVGGTFLRNVHIYIGGIRTQNTKTETFAVVRTSNLGQIYQLRILLDLDLELYRDGSTWKGLL
jgi:hypothetical protein